MKAKDFFVENWGLKLTALFLSFILWLMVHGDPGTERNIMIPLEIRIPRDMVITNEDRPSLVEVTIRGPLASGGFGQPSLICLLDLPTAPEGERLVPLTPQNINENHGVGNCDRATVADQTGPGTGNLERGSDRNQCRNARNRIRSLRRKSLAFNCSYQRAAVTIG